MISPESDSFKRPWLQFSEPVNTVSWVDLDYFVIYAGPEGMISFASHALNWLLHCDAVVSPAMIMLSH